MIPRHAKLAMASESRSDKACRYMAQFGTKRRASASATGENEIERSLVDLPPETINQIALNLDCYKHQQLCMATRTCDWKLALRSREFDSAEATPNAVEARECNGNEDCMRFAAMCRERQRGQLILTCVNGHVTTNGRWYETCRECGAAFDLKPVVRLYDLSPWSLKDAVKIHPNDKEVVTLAVQKHGNALEHASERLQDNRGIVTLAINESPFAFKYASDRLKNDVAIAKLAVRHLGHMLRHAGDVPINDRAVVELAVQNDGYALQYASDALKDDQAVVKLAVQQTGTALRFASYTLRDTVEIAELAVENDGGALPYASIRLQNDPEFVREVLRGYAR